MRKTFQLAVEGKNRDRLVDAVKHEIRKYLKRERRRDLPAGVDFLDFDCRFGSAADSAQTVHLNSLIPAIDAAVKEGATSCYVEILAKPGHRKARPPGAAPGPGAEANAEP
jgi:hypothetical protein